MYCPYEEKTLTAQEYERAKHTWAMWDLWAKEKH